MGVENALNVDPKWWPNAVLELCLIGPIIEREIAIFDGKTRHSGTGIGRIFIQ